MKKNVLFLVQARLNSKRVPQKMIKDFAGTTLIDVLLSKISKSKIIPTNDIYLSAHEDILKQKALKYNLNVFNRSFDSANSETDVKLINEWWNKLPYDYVVLCSACNPLLTIGTIENFYLNFLKNKKPSSLAVVAKKNYFWDSNKKIIKNFSDGDTCFNTKYVSPIFESANCLYASKTSIIGQGFFMDTKFPPDTEIFPIKEIEAFDIDEPWQFEVAEKLYNNISTYEH